MESKQGPKAVRWVTLGLVAGLALAWGGFSVAESAPSSITTCTKVSNNKTKVIATSAVAKCTYKAKGVAQNWDDHSVVVGLSGQLAEKNADLQVAKSDACALITEVAGDNELLNEFNGNPEFNGIVNDAAIRCAG